jgi:enoyl-CoA hydratase/carnithine racemase
MVLTATGKAFCAGMDLHRVSLRTASEAERFGRQLAQTYRALMGLRVPLFCAVDGAVRGGGMGIVAAADVVLAGPQANFALPEARLGLMPAIVSIPLSRRLSPASAAYLSITGAVLSAKDAQGIGLIDQVVTKSAKAHTLTQAEAIVSLQSRSALSRTKRFLSEGVFGEKGKPSHSRWDAAIAAFVESTQTLSARRGLAGFRQKVTVQWDKIDEDVA